MTSEQERADMIEQLRERLIELLHTKEGSRVAMQCVWHGTAKVFMYIDQRTLCTIKVYIISSCTGANKTAQLLLWFPIPGVKMFAIVGP